MPRRRTHIRAGVPAGAFAAAYRARDQTPACLIMEAIGGGVGGWLGAQMPDGLEPASLGRNHRGFCHSWSALLSGVAYTQAAISEWEQFCRQKADEVALRRISNSEQTDWDRCLLSIQEMAWRIAAGILAGIVAGYVSHLALDACTPSQLPYL